MSALVDFETIPQMFTRVAAHYQGRHRTALRYKDKKTKRWVDISWEAFNAQVQAFAGYLDERGVGFGDRVAILSENRPEWAVADLATQILGGCRRSSSRPTRPHRSRLRSNRGPPSLPRPYR